jgi:GTPase SAR1 family protein
MPSIDLDAILIAIRVASYGEKMTMKVNIPEVGEDEEFEIDLRPLLDNLVDNTIWQEEVKINNDLTFFINPVSYKTMTEYQLINFDSSRIIQALAQGKDLTEEQRMDLASMAMNRIADATVGQLINGVVRIESSNGNTNDRTHIKEFLENIDKDIFQKLADAFKDLNRHNNMRVFTVATPPQYIERGAPDKLDIPFEFDYSTFFV